jgi:uncharacterized damage-inducible protein DinB
MTAQEARMHIRYSGWASRKVLEAALALSPEDRVKPMSVSHEASRKRSVTSISATPSGIPGSPTPAIRCHPTMRFPPSIS